MAASIHCESVVSEAIRAVVLHIFPTASAAVRESIAEGYERGQKELPAPEISSEAFLRAIPPDAFQEAPEKLLWADLFVATAGVFGNAATVARFTEAYLRPAAAATRRASAASDFHHEVFSLLCHRLLVAPAGSEPRLRQYRGRGPLRSWLKATAVRIAVNATANKTPDDEDSLETELYETFQSPEHASISAESRSLFLQALTASVKSLETEDQLLLRLYFVDGVKMDSIGVMLQKSKSWVSRRIDKIAAQLWTRIRAALKDEGGLRASEFESLIRAAQSRISLRLSKVLPLSP
jgi:RNA polymerase sigma-70 factor, ECF subfamily